MTLQLKKLANKTDDKPVVEIAIMCKKKKLKDSKEAGDNEKADE